MLSSRQWGFIVILVRVLLLLTTNRNACQSSCDRQKRTLLQGWKRHFTEWAWSSGSLESQPGHRPPASCLSFSLCFSLLPSLLSADLVQPGLPTGPMFTWSPLQPSSTLRPATLSPAQLSHMSSADAVTKVRSTGQSPASTTELRGPSLVSGVQFQRRSIGGEICQKVSAATKRCLLWIPEHSYCALLTVW